MISAKRIGWVLVAATSAVTGVGAYVPELGIAISSLVLGGLALAVSLVVRARLASAYLDRISSKKEGWEALA